MYDDVGRADESPQAARMRLAMKALMVDHMAKVMPHDSIIALTARSYEQVFTGDQLRALVVFFSSALGQRYASGQHQVLAATMPAVRAAMRAREGELTAAIGELMQREIQSMATGVP